ncbi:hypothetical protein [Alteromonas oceanisediminis]|uniref:hypothetical protein n=1 Tax=Alteromonas oceanisediminis TaxID=2836180 RepID=UPI001BDAEFA0|nr:hypothetical protein [Alteromonas oceanisediminis]MBT0585579.1 hypothetical protein [Alteromonas oceanisediminis]
MGDKNGTTPESGQLMKTLQEGQDKTFGTTKKAADAEDLTDTQVVVESDLGLAIWLVPIYVLVYSLLALWLLVDGWLSGFSSLLKFWEVGHDVEIPAQIPFLFFTIVGSLLGSAILGITSFHRHYAISHSFNRKHIWGFYFAPLLATTVGCLIFAIVQSGLLVLTGDIANEKDPVRATLGYVAIGGIAGYNWDVFVKKLESLSQDLLNSSDKSN